MSPIFPMLKTEGAVFGQTMGYERPFYFDKENTTDSSGLMINTKTFSKPAYFDLVAKEYECCRERVALLDYSSFTKIDIWGKDVVKTLQYLCSNDVDVPIGSIIHTGMQNIYGGYENDCSLARVSENYYMMIAPTIQQQRCKNWLNKHIPKDSQVNFSDVTMT
uniref:CSON007742 protein n=1 Tax=Culicoides sonorensis TaxID=179676 RepID=A0A336N6P1_CULSO